MLIHVGEVVCNVINRKNRGLDAQHESLVPGCYICISIVTRKFLLRVTSEPFGSPSEVSRSDEIIYNRRNVYFVVVALCYDPLSTSKLCVSL